MILIRIRQGKLTLGYEIILKSVLLICLSDTKNHCKCNGGCKARRSDSLSVIDVRDNVFTDSPNRVNISYGSNDTSNCSSTISDNSFSVSS